MTARTAATEPERANTAASTTTVARQAVMRSATGTVPERHSQFKPLQFEQPPSMVRPDGDRFARNIKDRVPVKTRLRKLGVRLLSVVEG
jgi:hypothetical protein